VSKKYIFILETELLLSLFAGFYTPVSNIFHMLGLGLLPPYGFESKFVCFAGTKISWMANASPAFGF